MSRKPRNLQAGYSYHVTTRCNNREFKLSKRECREVFLYAINKALSKYKFKLYALCIMSNHVHFDPPKSPLKGRVDSFKLSTANFESINLTEDSQVYLFLTKRVSHNN